MMREEFEKRVAPYLGKTADQIAEELWEQGHTRGGGYLAVVEHEGQAYALRLSVSHQDASLVWVGYRSTTPIGPEFFVLGDTTQDVVAQLAETTGNLDHPAEGLSWGGVYQAEATIKPPVNVPITPEQRIALSQLGDALEKATAVGLLATMYESFGVDRWMTEILCEEIQRFRAQGLHDYDYTITNRSGKKFEIMFNTPVNAKSFKGALTKAVGLAITEGSGVEVSFLAKGVTITATPEDFAKGSMDEHLDLAQSKWEEQVAQRLNAAAPRSTKAEPLPDSWKPSQYAVTKLLDIGHTEDGIKAMVESMRTHANANVNPLKKRDWDYAFIQFGYRSGVMSQNSQDTPRG